MNLALPGPEELLNSRSLKWGMHPGKLGMWVAEMDFGIAPEVRAALQSLLDENLTGYPSAQLMKDTVRAAIEYQEEAFDTHWDIEDAGISTDVLSVFKAMLSLLDEGSPVAVPTPAYMPFLSMPQKQGHPVIEVPALRGEEGQMELDYRGLEQAFQAGARLLVLCNPWNPLGRALRVEELQRLDALLQAYPEVLVFNDEIHSPLVLEGDFTSYSQISAQAKTRTVTAISASKGWNIPALHCAQWLCADPLLRERVVPVAQLFASGATPWGMWATIAAYRQGREWLEAVKSQIRHNVATVRNWQESAGQTSKVAKLQIHLPTATYLSWWETRDEVLGPAPGERLLDAGVVVNEGASMGKGWEHSFRLNLACSDATLEQALGRVEAALG